jgi:hypothetical protein
VKKSIGLYSVGERISRINVNWELEESVGAKYSSSQLKLEASMKEVYSEVRQSFIVSICLKELISQSVDQLYLIK